MDLWSPPAEWGIGAHAQHLKNLYVYFWRWATLKVFGSGHREAVGGNKDGSGIICFITVAGFSERSRLPEDARGIAARLRGDLGHRLLAGRTPAGRQHTHFQGVQQPVCIVLPRARTRIATPRS